MRCPVPLLAACCWVALPHALLAQPAPAASGTAGAQTMPLEGGETKGQLPVVTESTSAAAGALEPSSEVTSVQPGDPVEEKATPEAAPTDASATTAEQADLRARIDAIRRSEPLDESVERPLEFARAALERSRASHAVGDTASETRTQKLARAAVALAEARLRLLRERSLYLSARGRHDGASAELTVAQHALERERARARELQRASAVP